MTDALAAWSRTSREAGLLWACASAADHLLPLSLRRLWRDVRVPVDTLAAAVADVCRAWGMPRDDVAIVVEKMLWADLRGIDSHGCAMLPRYQRMKSEGRLAVSPVVTVVRETETTALVDGGGGLGHVPATRAMALAIAKCRAAGVGAVAVRRSGHFGAAGAYVEMAAAEGFVGLVTTSTPTPTVVPTFGTDAKLGTNPVAIAAPGRRHRPFLLDMATSTVSLGTLIERWRRAGTIPSGWAIDERGDPVTSGSAAARGRRLTPLGGSRDHGSHKGYGLGVAVEILSSVLPGVAPADGSGRVRDEVGHFLLALDPGRFREGFAEDVDRLIDDLHDTRPADARQPVLVAGDPEAAALADRSAHGIPLSRTVIEDLRTVAREAGVPFLIGTARS